MELSLRYRDGQFTPSEAMTITGVPLHLQRDWRSQGLLKARESGRASFSPRELAEMRVMMKLRALGLPLAEAKKVAEDAAPGVVYAALANHPDRALVVDAPRDIAGKYLKALEQADDGYLLALSDLGSNEQVFRHALIQNGECRLLYALDENAVGDDVEVAGLVNFFGIAKEIVASAPRPLFTLVVPKGFDLS